MAGEILVSGEARGGSISAAIVTDEQRSLKPKDPCPFRKLILWAAEGLLRVTSSGSFTAFKTPTQRRTKRTRQNLPGSMICTATASVMGLTW